MVAWRLVVGHAWLHAMLPACSCCWSIWLLFWNCSCIKHKLCFILSGLTICSWALLLYSCLSAANTLSFTLIPGWFFLQDFFVNLLILSLKILLEVIELFICGYLDLKYNLFESCLGSYLLSMLVLWPICIFRLILILTSLSAFW